MSPPRKPRSLRSRRLRRIAVGVLIFAVCLVLSAPWWVPALVAHVAGAYGVTIGSWQARGWGRVEYRDIVFSQPGIDVRIDRAVTPRFLVLPRGPLRSGKEAPLEIGTVRVGLSKVDTTGERPPPGIPAIVRQVETIWAQAHRWLPAAHIDQVVVQAGGTPVELHELTWDRQGVGAILRIPSQQVEGTLALARADDGGGLEGQLRVPAAEAAVEVSLAPVAAGARLAATGTWRGSALSLDASFGPEGMVPREASLRAEILALPADILGLEGYGPINGEMQADWANDAYTVVLRAQADPRADSEWPAAVVDVRGSGSIDRLRVEAIDVELPAVRASLSQPLEIALDGTMPSSPARFSLEADLAAVAALHAQGKVSGQVVVSPGPDGRAGLDFTLAGSDLSWRTIQGASIAVRGRWHQPELVLESAQFSSGPAASAQASFVYDIGQQVIGRADLRAALPREVLAALSPAAPPCERIELTAEVSGPLRRPRHQGAAKVVGLEWMRERRVGGTLQWEGEGAAAKADGVLDLAGGGTLPFSVAGERAADGSVRGRIDALRWVDAEGEWWRLDAPVEAVFQPSGGDLQVSPWQIHGPELTIAGEARVRGPAVGDISLEIRGLEGRRIGGVLPEVLRGGRLDGLDLRARWDHGPAALDGHLRATYSPVAGTSYGVEADFVTREGGLAFGALQVQDASGVVLRGTGRLPLTFEGLETGFHADLRRDDPISLELDSVPNPVFWKSIADLTGWSVGDPRLSCRLKGSIAQPRGELSFAAGALQPPASALANGGQLPQLSGLRLDLAADEDGLSITQGMVAIDYRWVTLTGHAPWQVWRRWRETGEIDWRSGTYDLASNPLPIAIASRVFPSQLAPEGEVSIKISHTPADGFSGRIWLHGAAVRPIGPLGSIRDIASQLDFSGYSVKLTQLKGFLGGQPVSVTGEADINHGERPEFALRVKSSRVPLVRRAGLIVRTEVDLELKQGASGPVRVTGRVDFGPSLYSADLLELLPTGVDRPEKRPPYFSVEEKPLADWELDVAAHGEAFLRVSTPFYKDLLSTDVHLTGTLGEPRVEGWVWGTGGVVSFPFGRIPVEQVLVTLSRENPYQPQLIVSGAGRIMGYDIRMEASGSASEPKLLFTSDPPLTSQQVFLMLTTGAVPDDAHTIGATNRASRIALFLGRNLAAGLGIGGTAGGDERLDIRSGEDFTRQGRETIAVQYDLDGRWSIVGEYDRFDAYNGGIKFRIIDR